MIHTFLQSRPGELEGDRRCMVITTNNPVESERQISEIIREEEVEPEYCVFIPNRKNIWVRGYYPFLDLLHELGSGIERADIDRILSDSCYPAHRPLFNALFSGEEPRRVDLLFSFEVDFERSRMEEGIASVLSRLLGDRYLILNFLGIGDLFHSTVNIIRNILDLDCRIMIIGAYNSSNIGNRESPDEFGKMAEAADFSQSTLMYPKGGIPETSFKIPSVENRLFLMRSNCRFLNSTLARRQGEALLDPPEINSPGEINSLGYSEQAGFYLNLGEVYSNLNNNHKALV